MKSTYYTQERSGHIRNAGMGLIHAYFGQGVGKTTRAVGLSIRAAGSGLRVVFVQFLKSGTAGEANIFEQVPNISYRCPGKHPFILSQGPQSVHYEHAETSLWYAKRAIKEGTHLLICDEILSTPIFGVLRLEQLLELMDRCRGQVELVMTGIDADPAIRAGADYVTEFVQRKHPYYSGHIARKGIEY